MKSWSSREELVHQIVALKKTGTAIRATARALGVSRNTVKAILAEHDAARTATPPSALPEPARVPRHKKVEPFAGTVTDLLTRFPDITAQRVFEELRGKGYAGAYTAVKEHVRLVRPPSLPEPSLPTPVRGPGEMAESDWSPYEIRFTHAPKSVVQVMSYGLCFSRRKRYAACERPDLHALMAEHVATFERFGGAAHVCRYDSQKPVVLRWEGNQPVYNPRFLAFAAHYEFRVEACRRRKPNDKAKVERGFWHFERNFLNGRSFRDLTDFRAQLEHWHTTVLDAYLHRALRRSPLAAFAEEAPHLVPLPAHPYDTARVVYRVCSVDGFVSWDGNRYAVPYEAIYDLVPVRVPQRELFVYRADLRLLARHELAPRSAGKDVDPNHIHRPAERRGIDLDAARAVFEGLGDGAADFFAGLERLGPRLCGHHLRQILLLRERFGSEDIARALRRAHAYGAYEHLAIRRILDVTAKPRTLDEYVAEETQRRVAGRLGKDDTRPRDLDEYDRLPVLSAPATPEAPCHESQDPRSPSNARSTPMLPSSESEDPSKPSD